MPTNRPRARIWRLIQRGTIAFVAESSKTATITSVDTAKSSLNHLGNEGSQIDTLSIRLAFTNSTTITGSRGGTGSGATVGFEVTTGY